MNDIANIRNKLNKANNILNNIKFEINFIKIRAI